ncbi:hypothetical protein C5167_046318 [Papaver somniferum]|uniref:Endonuclease/exonuclease/phosphatase domain-containing protein n=1 Tax=Papaver somniferum TaxID=3469 RepID=A0A4Y7LGY5_PAPSO|nr:hypothetical protein C5167_046318 [Papaver somniferum]
MKEKSGGRFDNNNHNREFNRMIQDSGLMDMGYCGPAFTWTNNAVVSTPIYARLDRVLCSANWWMMFPEAAVFHLPRIGSDHSPIYLNTHRICKRRKPGYRFEYHWTAHPDFQDEVHKAWDNATGSTIEKLRDAGNSLADWGKKTFGNITTTVEDAKKDLLELQKSAHLRDIRIEEDNLKSKIEELMEVERKFWQQRNKSSWIPNVDRNTQVFHMAVKQRRKKNAIEALRDSKNNWVSGHNNISKLLIDHFSSNFNKDPQEQVHAVNFSSDTQITEAENKAIGTIPTQEEIWKVLKKEVALSELSVNAGDENVERNIYINGRWVMKVM